MANIVCFIAKSLIKNNTCTPFREINMLFLVSQSRCLPEQILLPQRRFILTHVFFPVIFLGLLFAEFHWGAGDVWLGVHFYDAVNHQWPYKESALIKTVFHTGGQIVFFTLVAGILLLLLHSFKSESRLKNCRRNLAYLFFASITSPIINIILKSKSAIYCPWDLKSFGGLNPHVHLFATLFNPIASKAGHCFPAAHAGSGFAFVSLYFFFLTIQAEYKFYGLSFGLALGGIYGFSQQMRGAHFLSHDLFAFAVCWYSSLFLFWLFFRKQLHWIKS